MRGTRRNGAPRPPRGGQGSLGYLVLAILALFSLLSISFQLGPGWGLLVFASGIGLLGVAAWFWGVDSRDGKNWKR